MKPSWIEFRVPFVVIDFGVKWQIYEPEVFVSSSPWVDGPYCPKCDEELVGKNRGLIFKKNLWTCRKCEGGLGPNKPVALGFKRFRFGCNFHPPFWKKLSAERNIWTRRCC